MEDFLPKNYKELNDNCPKCGSKVKHGQGVKNGKHWQGWFCVNEDCKNVIWGPKIQDDWKEKRAEMIADQQYRWGEPKEEDFSRQKDNE